MIYISSSQTMVLVTLELLRNANLGLCLRPAELATVWVGPCSLYYINYFRFKHWYTRNIKLLCKKVLNSKEQLRMYIWILNLLQHSFFFFSDVACRTLVPQSESEVAQSCLTLCDPIDCSLPGSSSMGFSRQEYWSGVPLPSPGCPREGNGNPLQYPCLKNPLERGDWRTLVQRVTKSWTRLSN